MPGARGTRRPNHKQVHRLLQDTQGLWPESVARAGPCPQLGQTRPRPQSVGSFLEPSCPGQARSHLLLPKPPSRGEEGTRYRCELCPPEDVSGPPGASVQAHTCVDPKEKPRSQGPAAPAKGPSQDPSPAPPKPAQGRNLPTPRTEAIARVQVHGEASWSGNHQNPHPLPRTAAWEVDGEAGRGAAQTFTQTKAANCSRHCGVAG